ncbi:MAG TPA: hypothetical protein VKT33_02420 [Candidatus Angelobacter sp.]|nr:hypothetical protein [Candidatus Angelobacter sp.]
MKIRIFWGEQHLLPDSLVLRGKKRLPRRKHHEKYIWKNHYAGSSIVFSKLRHQRARNHRLAHAGGKTEF